MSVLSDESRLRSRTVLLVIIAEMMKPIRSITKVNTIAFLAQQDGHPIEYEFELLGNEMVVSDDLFTDLMILVDQGLVNEDFEEKNDRISLVFTANYQTEDMAQYFTRLLSEKTHQSIKDFMKSIRNLRTEGDLKKMLHEKLR